VAKLLRVPLAISSVRNVDIHGAFVLTMFERLMSRITDLVIANAESVKEYVSRIHRIAASRIHVIYNGISMDRIAQGAVSAAAGVASDRWGVGPRTVTMIASLTPKKDHATFLAAARIVRSELPETRFLVVGDGPLRQELEARVREMEIEDSVLFTGEVDDTAALLAAIDVSVLTSLKEGCSNSVIESMAAGKPVVATRVGGNPELVEDGVTGFVVPAGDAHAVARRVIELLSNPELRRRMGEAGQARAWARFTAERMVEETTSLYLSVLRERVPGLVEWVETTEARGGPRMDLPRRDAGSGSRRRIAGAR
jgi:glycosyltransferase involved in cell wall biosynthesis